MKFLKETSSFTLFFAASLITFVTYPRLVESKEQQPLSVTQQALQQLKSNNNTSSNSSDDDCPMYGCVLLPRDIYFDEQAQTALKALRARLVHDVPSKSSSSSESAIESEKEMSFQQALEMLKSLGSEDQATLTLIGFKGGSLEEQVNQDRAFVISPFKVKARNQIVSFAQLIGVFDGHAQFGEQVSEYSVSTLPKILSEKLERIFDKIQDNNTNEQPVKEIENALVETFIEVDKSAPAEFSGGCTASIVLQIGSYAYVANAGDSRSFIATYNKRTKKVMIEFVSKEDKPHLPEERRRIESMNGQVYIPPPEKLRNGASSRVMFIDRMTGRTHGLAMSRSIGDWAAGERGVIPDPTVNILDISKMIRGGEMCDKAVVGVDGTIQILDSCPKEQGEIEAFAVSATDGLLDFISVESIADTVAMSLFVDDKMHPLSACEKLITTAANEWWKAKNGRYRDDIAIAITKLKLVDPF